MKQKTISILLIEDSSHDIELLQIAAEKANVPLQLKTIQDGESALVYLHQMKHDFEGALPDLILLDLNLPKRGGLDFLGELKKDPTLRSIPVIVLSTSNYDVEIEKCYRLHAAAYVIKPLEYPQLMSFMKKLHEFWQYAEFPNRD